MRERLRRHVRFEASSLGFVVSAYPAGTPALQAERCRGPAMASGYPITASFNVRLSSERKVHSHTGNDWGNQERVRTRRV
jgi:hypothetical protein